MAVAQVNVGFQVQLKELGEKLAKAAALLENHRAKFQEVGSSIGQAGMYIGRYVDQMTGTVITSIGGVVAFIPEIISGFSKLNALIVANPWIAAAAAIAAAGAALYLYTKRGSEAAQMQRMLNGVNAEALKSTAKERAEIDSLLNIAKDDTVLKKDRLDAIKKLNEISPEYLGGINLENVNTKEASSAIKEYVEALNSKARAQALLSKRAELYQQQIEQETKAIEHFQPVADALSRAFKGQEGVVISTQEQLEDYIKTLDLTTEEIEKFRGAYEKQLKILEEGRLKFQRKIEILDEYAKAKNAITETSKSLTEGTIGYYENEIKYFENLQKNAALSSAQYKLYASEIEKYKAKIASIDGGPKVKDKTKENEKINIGTIKFYEAQISALKKYQQEEAVTVDQFSETAEKIQAIQQKIDAITGKREKQSSLSMNEAPVIAGSTAEMEKQIVVLQGLADKRKAVFGEADFEYQALKNKIADLEFEIKVKVDEAGFSLATEGINRLKQEVELQGEVSEAAILRKQQEAQMYAGIVGDAFNQLSGNLLNSMGEAETGMERFGQAMAGVVLKLISMALSNAMANAIVGATQSGNGTGIAAVFTTPAFIATAISGILGAFASIPKFADGGVVFGPTLGLMGEYAGATTNPEVIAPLNKLKEMITPAGNNTPVIIGGNIKLRGRDLELVLDRTNNRNERIR